MKISGVRSRVAAVPIRRKVIASIGTFDTFWAVLVDVETDEGLSGSTYLWAFSQPGARAVQQILVELAEVAVGEDPFFSARLWRAMRRRTSQWGREGLALIALSGVDVAVWDLVGKALGKPLAHVLGAHADPVPTYASEGLFLYDDLGKLAAEAEELVGLGFKAVKMRLGRRRMADDVEAVRVVREAIGPDVTLMADANQGWDPDYTIQIGRRLERFELYWLEEPIPHDDLAGHARIAAALDTRLASGENLYGPEGFRRAVDARAFEILMPDVERVGGVTGWMRTIGLAEAYNLPVCSHLFPQVSLHLIAATPTACFLEHMPWGAELFQEQIELVDGTVPIPDRPGIGFNWDEAALRRFVVD